MTLALVRDLREQRVLASAEELADFETDVLAHHAHQRCETVEEQRRGPAVA